MTPTPGPQHAGLTVLRLLRLFSYINGLRRVLWGGSKLFDREYYLACNPDVGLSRVPPLAHFLLFGAFEGRKPNPLFDPAFYIRQQGSSFDRVTNPLLHYLERGAAHGLKPHPLFEPDGKGSSLGRYLRALTELPDSILYQWWLKQESRVKPLPLRTTPRFSVLLEVSQPRRGWLEEAVASVRSQTYPDWELHITNRADEPWVKSYLDELASDPRIHLGWHGRRPVVRGGTIWRCAYLRPTP
jgi:hypothetical protein